MVNQRSVIVVGGGHNGLTCAAYLARAGVAVTVCERRDVLGGACVTEELIPGYRCSTASLVTSLFRPEIVAELDLAAHGLEFIPRNPSVVAVYPDGRHLSLGSDERACAEEIAQFSVADAEAYPAYGRTMGRLARFIEPILMNPLPGLTSPDAGAAVKAMLHKATELPDDDLVMLLELLGGSAAGFLDRWFESDQVKVPLVIDGITGVDASPSMPGSAYLMLYHMTGITEVGRPAWGQVRGGMGGITAALASAARAHGAVIRSGSPVARILVGGDGRGRARGVVLESGEELLADAVVSAADPYTTFIRLLDEDVLPARFRHAMENRRFHAVAMKMHLALDRLPDVAGFPPGLGPQHHGTLLIAPTMRYLEEAYADYKAGHPSVNPHIECTIPSVLDPTVAPEGKHLMGIYLQYTPYAPDGGWDSIKESYADRVLECMEPYLPGITESVIDRCVLTPADLEQRLGLTGGDLYHGAMTGDQLFFRRPGEGVAGSHHTPLDGLYLCGSGTHPGGGVFGVPGRNGARAVLTDLELEAHRREP